MKFSPSRLFFILFFSFIFILSFSPTHAFALTAKIIKAKGRLYKDGIEIKPPQIKSLTLNEGATLEIRDKNSFFIIEYSNGSRLMLAQGKLKIEELKEKKTFLQLLKGTLHNYTNPHSSHQFKVKTKNASFAVRGTKFWLKQSQQESYLCVCTGTVAVRNNHSLMLVQAGEDAHVENPLGTLTKSKANDMMWKMATGGFEQMGIPVETDPRKK
ncbi:MAG: hypothetical protein CME63_08280 [Halobacteriovoraceae bacterium]|nr:hypothetical protein [Halobacteriovoraceae bacterium]|tara:strand:+ start:30941 stop:31579 length:639 start_codon:yes stop_codon:yes gene_type:complete